mmetsp:Transcript_9753/g.12817  ORF Transcript_9753/g.12817 Transcript_9753/m.12817 type:complete len:187 (+) Transcript_9753:30-590(+)
MRKRGFCYHINQENIKKKKSLSNQCSSEFTNDVESALQILREKCQVSQPNSSPLYIAPLIIKSHISTIIEDRTEIERSLEDMRRRNVVKFIKLNNSSDMALLLTSDYIKLIHSISPKKETLKLKSSFENLVKSSLVTSISSDEIFRCLKLQKSSFKAQDILSNFVDSGFLRPRDTTSHDSQVCLHT